MVSATFAARSPALRMQAVSWGTRAPGAWTGGAPGTFAGAWRIFLGQNGREVAFRMPPGGPSAADLKFLHRPRQTHLRNFKSKSGTRIIWLPVPLLLPKFV